jgi:hypothetical protein
MFATEAHRLGLTSRPITPEDYFADYLASSNLPLPSGERAG